MDWVWLTFYGVSIAAFGMAEVARFSGKQSRILSETIGIIMIFGTGSLGFGLFLLGLLGVRPTRMSIGIICLAAVGYIVLHIRKRKIPVQILRPAFLDNRWYLYIVSGFLLSLLFVFQSMVLAHALAFPMQEWDAFAIWGLKAKVIAIEGIQPKPAYFSDITLSYSHLDYPLMVPFLISGVYGLFGHVDDRVANLFQPLLNFGLMCIVYGFSRRRLPKPMALAVTTIIMGTPVILRWAGSGIADLPLTAFYTAAAVYLLEWEESSTWHSCVMCGVMSAFAGFTKNEGLALGALNCAVMFFILIGRVQWKSRLAGAGLYTVVFGMLILPWILWSIEIPRTHENYLEHFRFQEITENMFRIPIILTEFARQIVNVRLYGLFWITLISSAIIGWRAFRCRTTLIAWLLFLLHLGIYILTFCVTPWELKDHMRTAIDRLLLHVVPLGGLLITLHLSFVKKEGIQEDNGSIRPRIPKVEEHPHHQPIPTTMD